MSRRLLLLAALFVLPLATASSQRTRATKRDPSVFSDDDTRPAGPALRSRDVEDLSPVKVLLDKKKDLKLTDAQVEAVKKADGPLKEQNAPLLKAVDSLVREMRPALNPTPESMVKTRQARVALDEAIDSIKVNYDAAAKSLVSGLDADQQAKANDLLGKARDDGNKKLREKMGGGRGGRGGSGGPGGI